MTIKEAFISHLLDQAAVTAIVGQRVRPVKAAQAESQPLLVVTLVSTEPQHHSGAASNLRRAAIEVTCQHTGEKNAADLAEVVNTSLDGKQGSIGGAKVRSIMLRDLRDSTLSPTDGSEVGPPSVTLDYDVWYQPD